MDDDERLTRIREFTDYLISDYGEVYNRHTGRRIRLTQTHAGDVKVGLYRNGTRYTRAVSRLVAEAYLDSDPGAIDWVVVLDGDKTNLRADNLVWRPPWFAWKYSRQLKVGQPDHYHNLKVRNVDTGVIYSSIIETCVTEGLLFDDVWKSTWSGYAVYPSENRYEITDRV